MRGIVGIKKNKHENTMSIIDIAIWRMPSLQFIPSWFSTDGATRDNIRYVRSRAEGYAFIISAVGKVFGI